MNLSYAYIFNFKYKLKPEHKELEIKPEYSGTYMSGQNTINSKLINELENYFYAILFESNATDHFDLYNLETIDIANKIFGTVVSTSDEKQLIGIDSDRDITYVDEKTITRLAGIKQNPKVIDETSYRMRCQEIVEKYYESYSVNFPYLTFQVDHNYNDYDTCKLNVYNSKTGFMVELDVPTDAEVDEVYCKTAITFFSNEKIISAMDEEAVNEIMNTLNGPLYPNHQNYDIIIEDDK